MIKAIIFDVGGVVFKARIEEVYEKLAKKLGIPLSKFEAVRKKYKDAAQRGEISTEELLTKMSSELNVDKSKLRALWQETYSETMVVDNDVLEFVDLLKEKGYATALITNTTGIHTVINKMRGIYGRFSPAILSNEVGMRKPEERIYKEMLKRLKLKAEECVFTDDREEHLEPARKLGMRPIAFKTLGQFKRELKKLNVEF